MTFWERFRYAPINRDTAYSVAEYFNTSGDVAELLEVLTNIYVGSYLDTERFKKEIINGLKPELIEKCTMLSELQK